MSKIVQVFGAAMIAGAGAIASQIEPIETALDNAMGDAKEYAQTELGINEEQALEIGLGSAVLLALLGLGVAARGARHRIEDQPEAVNDNDDENQNDLVLQELGALRDQVANMDNAVILLENKVLKPLNIDTAGVEAAIAKLQDTELAAGQTLDAIRNIEIEVSKVAEAMKPRDFTKELANGRADYNEAHKSLVSITAEAFSDFEGYTKQNAKIMAKLSSLDATIKQSVLSGAAIDVSLPSAFLETVAEQLGEVEDEIGESYYFSQIVENASLYVHKATDYLLTNLEMRQAAQEMQNDATTEPHKPALFEGPGGGVAM